MADRRVADRRQRGGEARRAAQDPGLHEWVLRVELTIGRGEQSFDHLTDVGLGGGHRQTTQPTGHVEVRHPGAFEEDLLDVAPGEQVGQRAEVGDRTQQLFGDRLRLGEREGIAPVRALLVVGDRAEHLAPHLGRLDVGTQPSSVEPVEHVGADELVRATEFGHDRGHRATSDPVRRSS